jgi:hypothetical protein
MAIIAATGWSLFEVSLARFNAALLQMLEGCQLCGGT